MDNFRSWTLGREFNSEDWGQYLKEHPKCCEEIVYEHIGTFCWQFNINGFCMNRHCYGQKERPNYRVYTWEEPEDKTNRTGCIWAFSCEINESTWGGYAGSGTANTEREAIVKGLRQIVAKYKTEAEYYKNNPAMRDRCLSQVEKAQADIINQREPELFTF